MTNAALEEVTGQAIAQLCRPVETEATAWLKSVGPQLARFKRQQAIEEAIVEFFPDAEEAAELLDAITASLKVRYEDHAEDAIRLADKFRAALDEVEPPAECIDEMTLAKDAAIAESGR